MIIEQRICFLISTAASNLDFPSSAQLNVTLLIRNHLHRLIKLNLHEKKHSSVETGLIITVQTGICLLAHQLIIWFF